MSDGTDRSRAAAGRIVAWALLALTVVLVLAANVLGAVGADRRLGVEEDWRSRLLLVTLGGTVALLFAAVGLLVARAEPRNAIGWIFLAAAAMLSATAFAYGYADLAVLGGEPWPGGGWMAWFANWGLIPPVFVAPCFVAQLFPDGRPLPGGWRWFLWGSLVVAAASALASALDPGVLDPFPPRTNPLGAPEPVGGFVSALNDMSGVTLAVPFFLASLAALATRFRRSRGTLRQQMKWLTFAGAVPVAAFGLSFVWGAAVGDGPALSVIFITGFASLTLIPVAVGIAILRYRLYEIDRVISRTLVYGSLTVVLGAAYVALVLAGQAFFSSFAGGGDLAIAASTLVVAALFLPLRRRVQRLVDRRFYRRRYDAQRTLEAFGTRLREQVELDGLRADLQSAVRETMQPAHLSIWLRQEARP